MIIQSSGYYIFETTLEAEAFIAGIIATSKHLRSFITANGVIGNILDDKRKFNDIFIENMREYGFDEFYAINSHIVEYIIALSNVTV